MNRSKRFIICIVTVLTFCHFWSWREFYLLLYAPVADSIANSYRVSNADSATKDAPVPSALVKSSSNLFAENIWVPVSRAEQHEYSVFRPDCSNRTGYNICCLGQCHQQYYQHSNPHEMLFKWVGDNGRSMANIADLIRAAKQHLFGQNNSGSCNFVFVGDSLTVDHAMAAMCQASLLRDNTGNFVYKEITSSCYPRFGAGSFGNGSCDSHGWNRSYQTYAGQNYIELGRINDDTSLCQTIIIVQVWMWDQVMNKIKSNMPLLMSGLSRLPNSDKGIMLWNWGTHCNDPTAKCVENAMNHTLSHYALDPQFHLWKMMWRETEPQHFANTYDGQYNPKLSVRWVCGDIKVSRSWRNVEAHHVLKDQNLSHRVALVPIFEQSVPLTKFHHPPDCTHYCYSPWRFEVTWDGMVQGLDYLASAQSNASENRTLF